MHPPALFDQPQPAIPPVMVVSLLPHSAGQRTAAQTCSIVMAVVGGVAVGSSVLPLLWPLPLSVPMQAASSASKAYKHVASTFMWPT